ncbi:MAG: hypothetical protein HYX75_20120 [Acidobacteria bacterium]|nr:hypothetical protein [Acidobacteriota bacterium]
MKRWVVIGCCTIGVTAVAFIWYSNVASRSDPKLSGSVSVSRNDPILGVDALMKDVDRHREKVQIEGVVSAVSADKQTLALIDLREFQLCGIDDCALTLPVLWTGAMPSVKDLVKVEGRVRQSEGKLIFVASALERARAPTGNSR